MNGRKHLWSKMDYHRYLASTTRSSDEVLQDWRWLIGPQLQLWQVTKTGDAFLRDSQDGSIHFLNTVAGEIERIAPDEQGFESAVAVPENSNRWLMPDVVKGQRRLGMSPGPDQCLSFKIPPALGGQLDPDNFELTSILVHFSINGQIHEQIKDLPAGAKIHDIKIEGQNDWGRRR